MRVFIAIAAVLALASGIACAYPTCENVAPTADVIGSGTIKLATESDHANNSFNDRNTQYFYTQFGIGDKFEAGVDFYDTSRSNDKFFNAKYLVMAENGETPALAVGVWNVSDISKPIYYAVGLKSFGGQRFHLGLQTQSDAGSVIAAWDWAFAPKFTLAADFQSGAGRAHTLGLFYKVTSNIDVSIYGLRNNTRELKDADYIGVYAGYSFVLGQ